MTIKYEYLADCKEQADKLGEAVYYQWEEMYKRQGKTVSEVTDTVKARAVTDAIPLTMVALENGTVCGSVTLKVNDFADYPDLTPWLAGVFVMPDSRGRGISKGLIAFAEKVAYEKFGKNELYLYTGSASTLYSKLGYKIFDTVHRGDKTLTLMRKGLK